MARKIDKIEKEMGYCEIKLEKERRLRRQVEFLRADLEVLDRLVRTHRGVRAGITQLPFAKIGAQIALERQSRDKPGPYYRRAKEQFQAAGILELVAADREILEREIGDIEAKFDSFSDFLDKRDRLAEEKREALLTIAPQRSGRLLKLNADFKKIEHLWNSLTEDSLNLDEAMFFMSRNVDYLRSSRSFLVAAKGSFDIETWMEYRFQGNLFRHSNVGRAKEMIDGANRNLKLAHKELVCVSNLKFEIESFETCLVKFLDALFDDIFLDGRIERSIPVTEQAIRDAEARLKKLRRRSEQLHKRLERAERSRVSLFQRLGGEKRGRVALSS